MKLPALIVIPTSKIIIISLKAESKQVAFVYHKRQKRQQQLFTIVWKPIWLKL